nr:hypothetical protein [Tanacetum cinerariifolium]
ACPHHGFSELHHLDTFYNALNINDQDSLNSAAGGNFLDKMPRECLKIIESKSKVRQTQAKAVVAKSIASRQEKPILSSSSFFYSLLQLKQNRGNQGPSANSSSQSTAPIQSPVAQPKTQTPVSEPVVALVNVPVPSLKPSIPYPSRRDNERPRDQANEQIEKFYEIFKDMSFEISFTDALILMSKFVSTLKALIGNKDKLSEMAKTPMNEHFLAVILNNASINLMPLSVWEGLLLLELTLSCMTLELVDRLVSKPIGIAKDVSIKVGVFHFSVDFVVVDFEPAPQVPLILKRCFLKTSRALIDVHKGKLTLHIRNEAITYNLDQTSRYSANYNQMMPNKIDVICEEYSQRVLGFSDTTASGNPTPYDDPIVSTTSPTLTLFGDSDFLLFEEADAFLRLVHTARTRRPQPKGNKRNARVLFASKSSEVKKNVTVKDHRRTLLLFKNQKIMSSECNNIKLAI